MKHSILCVDDEVDNVDSLERLLRRKYTVLKATSGHDALKLLDQNRVSLIISDQRMPVMTGVEFLRKAQLKQPDATRILLTGFADIEVVIEAVNSGGIYRYLNKPWDPTDLLQTVDSAVERFAMAQELVEKNRALQVALSELRTLDQAKTQFMMLINHELKTPLTSILSFTELARETLTKGPAPLGTEVDEAALYVDRIAKSAGRLRSLVDDSLQLMRLETGQVSVSRSEFDATTVLRSVLARPELEALIVRRKLVLIDQKVDARLSVRTDRALFEALIFELIENAAQFAPEGSRLELELGVGHAASRGVGDASGAGVVGAAGGARDDAAPGGVPLESVARKAAAVHFRVRNEAPALTQEKLAGLLKPFTLNEEAWNHSKGTGLGLALAQATAKVLGLSFTFALDGKVAVAGIDLSH